ncbi:LamG domain-containing protein [Flavobacterium sp. MAH-1]|uniref:LamG domain-containing protein n=1 Tax=Flavobacterium agri TaxID=2743471 RepID=A0A7Y8Y1P4_9FLAO|nr:LamG domain-containing protein [Flavobacterium agri]NUY80970.1 LamG domain-containing protein [Flavobacterium agri]NYA70994.1 LamG domain-containing protein [Flavobacterium agri]
MKNFIKPFLLVFVIGLATLISCQDEENQNNPSAGLLDKTSAVTQKLQQLTGNNTSIDNVIDSTDCFSVKLPVQVMTNGAIITVDDPEDYQTVEDILQQTPVGGFVDFVFPITLITASYEEIVVNNEDELVSEVADCFGFESIGCLSLNYPININLYDTGSQNPSTITIDNNQEFYLTLFNLTATDVYEIDYPITAINASGQTITINSNDELDTAIASAISDCDCDNDTPLRDDLILYLTFANEVNDLTGLGNSLAIGETEFVNDRNDNGSGALSLTQGNADNQVVTAGNVNNDMLQNNAFTVSIWFNRQINNFQGPAEILFQNSQLQISLEGPASEIRAPKVIAPGAEMVDQDWIDGQLFGQIGVWHHVVVTWDGNMLSLYRDGELRAESTAEFSGVMPPNFIGGNFQGFVDDVRVYKRALNFNEINTLFNLEGDINTCL